MHEDLAIHPIDSAADTPRTLRSLRSLPGPRALPLLGNLHQLDGARIHRSIEAMSETYGRYFRVRLGRREMLVVAEPAAIGKILRDRPEGWRRTQLIETVFAELGFAGVFATNGELWRAQRKMVAAALDPRHIKAYFPSLARVTERLYRRWCRHAERGTTFDLQADLMRYTVDVVAGLAFGVDFNTIESASETIQTHLNRIFPMLQRRLAMPVPYWRWFKLPADRALDRSLAKVHPFVADLITKARERLQRHPELRTAPSNLIEAMLIERDAPGTSLTDYDVASNILTLLLAGEDTTANTLAWLIYLVSGDTGAMQRLAEEADRLFGASRWANRLELASALTYTAACAQETMRLKPVAPLVILEANAPTTVGDIAIPAGTVVMALMRRGATDPRHFNRPEVFDPERWSNTSATEASPAGRERASMPFGAGPRVCPGRNLALLEINLVTSMLFRNFTIASLQTADGAPVEEWLAFTMAPSKLLVTLAHRDSSPAAVIPDLPATMQSFESGPTRTPTTSPIP